MVPTPLFRNIHHHKIIEVLQVQKLGDINYIIVALHFGIRSAVLKWKFSMVKFWS